MLHKIFRIAASFALVVATTFGGLTLEAHAATLDPTGQACEALGAASGSGGSGCTDPAGPDVNSTLKTAINLLSIVVGFAAVVMIIVGGLKYILSQGEGSNTASAKNTILYAMIGLIIVALAQVIVQFTLSKTSLPPCPVFKTTLADGSPCRP